MDDLVPAVDTEYDVEFTARRYDHVSTHSTKADALGAMELTAGGSYASLYNYGAKHGESVYRCIAHTECMKLMRVIENDGET
jgi:hypothetical protein